MPAGTYVKVSARKWIFNVSSDGGTTWVPILGLKTFTLGESSTKTDTTDYEADGEETHEVMSRTGSLKLEGFFLEDSTGARDPGQAAVEAFGRAVGSASIGDFKATSPSGKLYTFSGSVDIGDEGGDNNAKTSFSATISRSGGQTLA